MEESLHERVAQLEAETFALRACVQSLLLTHVAPRSAASVLLDRLDNAATAAVRRHGEDVAVEAFARTRADVLPTPQQWRLLDGR